MGIMQFNIPDDVKAAFEAAYQGQDADAVVAELLRKALEESQATGTPTSFAERTKAIRDRCSRSYSDEDIRRMRDELRE